MGRHVRAFIFSTTSAHLIFRHVSAIYFSTTSAQIIFPPRPRIYFFHHVRTIIFFPPRPRICFSTTSTHLFFRHVRAFVFCVATCLCAPPSPSCPVHTPPFGPHQVSF